MTLIQQKSPSFRQDIQVLRGIAVLLVLVFHAKIFGLAAGYLGVDMFYVISGFLITGLVAKKIDGGVFSIITFYINRARRLLPAAYIVYLATAIAAYFLLTTIEYKSFQSTLLGAITFTANIELWQNTNYFSTAAKLNPLTHTWSLAIEEQYYLLLPLTLVLTPRKFWRAGCFLIFAASIGLCLYFTVISPAASFYLLPTRAWELALGSWIALSKLQMPKKWIFTHLLIYIALIIVVLIPAFAPGIMMGSLHPGLDAILVCFATAYLLIAKTSFLETGIVANSLAKVGNISYSLYLVHWPLFAFAYNIYLSETPPLSVRIFLLILSFVLSFGLYKFVETPFRRVKFSAKKALIIGVTTSIAIVAVSQGLQYVKLSEGNYIASRVRNPGFSPSCSSQTTFKDTPKCRNSDTPKILVWGDSFAMHLIPGLASTTDMGIQQSTRSTCGPLLGIAPFRPRYNMYETWAKTCLTFNQSVLDFLATDTNIDLVILSSPFSYYLKPGAQGLHSVDGQTSTITFSSPVIADALSATVTEIQKLGKRVAIVGPTPTLGFNIGLCNERLENRLLTLGPNSTCEIQKNTSKLHKQKTLDMLKMVEDKTGGIIIYLDEVLCNQQGDDGQCPTKIGNTSLYLDAHHFTIEGSRAVAKQYDLIGHILSHAK